MLQLDKGHNDMSKFLNRILGMKVEKQNILFKYFTDTLNAIINQAKRTGKYDQVRLRELINCRDSALYIYTLYATTYAT